MTYYLIGLKGPTWARCGMSMGVRQSLRTRTIDSQLQHIYAHGYMIREPSKMRRRDRCVASEAREKAERKKGRLERMVLL